MKVELGQEITITCFYKRVKKFENKKRWKIWETAPLKKDIKGVIVGVRTISNGITDYESEGYLYSPKYHFPALLVSYSLSRNPILVPINDIPF